MFWFTILQSVRLWHAVPKEDCKQIHEWFFPASSIKSVSQYKRDVRAVFLYVYENGDDFQLFFPSEGLKQRYFQFNAIRTFFLFNNRPTVPFK